MTLTVQQLRKIMPKLSLVKAEAILPHLHAAMAEFNITTPLRVASFLANLAHESGQLSRTEENLNYRTPERLAAVFRRLRGPDGRPNALAYQVVGKPEEIAEAVYGNREDLGNRPGDGWRYRGMGLPQLTGRANFRAAGQALGLPLEDQPELVKDPAVGLRVMGWFWKSRNLNSLADMGPHWFGDVVAKYNGPKREGLKERLGYYGVARQVLGG